MPVIVKSGLAVSNRAAMLTVGRRKIRVATRRHGADAGSTATTADGPRTRTAYRLGETCLLAKRCMPSWRCSSQRMEACVLASAGMNIVRTAASLQTAKALHQTGFVLRMSVRFGHVVFRASFPSTFTAGSQSVISGPRRNKVFHWRT